MAKAKTIEPEFINVLEPSEFSSMHTVVDHLYDAFDDYTSREKAGSIIKQKLGVSSLYWPSIKFIKRSELADAWNAMRVQLGYTEIVDR